MTGLMIQCPSQLLVRSTSRGTDKQGKMLSLGPVTVTGNLAKKWLTSLGHEQISILMHELSRAGRGERRRGRDITTDPTDMWEKSDQAKCDKSLCRLCFHSPVLLTALNPHIHHNFRFWSPSPLPPPPTDFINTHATLVAHGHDSKYIIGHYFYSLLFYPAVPAVPHPLRFLFSVRVFPFLPLSPPRVYF